ncbi:SRPBCC domain-containing protein [Aquipuribacter sp. SD81]|uniref:SRPBCC domain-containing protein n=1 Tax=Aquipuribacter sp. SD81 TaxID=3127703 RepID=UPI0030173362
MDLEPIGVADRLSGRVVLRRPVACSVPTAWRAASEADGLSAWLGRHEGPRLGPGATFTLVHEQQVRSTHTVLEWEPSRLLAMTWDFPDEAPSRVRLSIGRDTAGTVVTLEHAGLEDAVAYAAGWHVHLDYLAELLRGRPRSFDDFWVDYDALRQRYDAEAG